MAKSPRSKAALAALLQSLAALAAAVASADALAKPACRKDIEAVRIRRKSSNLSCLVGHCGAMLCGSDHQTAASYLMQTAVQGRMLESACCPQASISMCRRDMQHRKWLWLHTEHEQSVMIVMFHEAVGAPDPAVAARAAAPALADALPADALACRVDKSATPCLPTGYASKG